MKKLKIYFFLLILLTYSNSLFSQDEGPEPPPSTPGVSISDNLFLLGLFAVFFVWIITRYSNKYKINNN